MSTLQAYLNSSKARKALSTKPGEEGFSLIELVVVVAVLAALSAIAIPNFVNMSEKARAVAAANTVATVAKECAVKIAEDVSSPAFGEVTLAGYSHLKFTGGGTGESASTTACYSSGTIKATSSDEKKYPSFIYNASTGAKTCDATSGNPAATGRGCTSGKW